MARLFCAVHHEPPLTAAAHSGLGPPPAGRSRRATQPPSLVQHRSQQTRHHPPEPPPTFVFTSPAGPQPRHGPWRPDRVIPLPDPGPRREVHRRLRRDPRQRGPGNYEDPAADAAGELLRREMDTHDTSRVHRPDAHLRRTPPAISPRRVRRPLQPAPPAPVPPAATARPGNPEAVSPWPIRAMTERAGENYRLVRWSPRAGRMLRGAGGGRGHRWRVRNDRGGGSARTRARRR